MKPIKLHLGAVVVDITEETPDVVLKDLVRQYPVLESVIKFKEDEDDNRKPSPSSDIQPKQKQGKSIRKRKPSTS